MFKPVIDKVIENDQCIGCGACVDICPRNNLVSAFNEKLGAMQANIVSAETCAGCPAPCDKVCPSIEVNLPQLALSLQAQQTVVDREGPVINRYVGYSPTFQFNNVSSSGGIIRQTLSYYLQNGFNVVCLGRKGDEFEPTLLSTAQQLNTVPGSIYHSISYHGAIDLIKQSDKKVVLVTIPCHLEGIAKYARETGWDVYENVHLIVGIICGWMYTRHSLQAFARYKSIEGEVKKGEYRGEDRAGLLKLKVNNEVYKYNRRQFSNTTERVDYMASFSKSANLLRCRLCENHLNVLADVSVGDAWLARNPKGKLSVIVTRTQRGEAAINELKEKALVVIEPGEEGDIIESQSANLVYGKDARRFNKYLRGKGQHTVNFTFSNSETATTDEINVPKYTYELLMRRNLRAGNYRLFRWMYVALMTVRKVVGKLKKRGK